MLRLFRPLFVLLARFVRSRRDLLLENLALRQQLAVLKKRHPQPRFMASDKLFWVTLRRLWPGWKQSLILFQPETVVRWHRAGFKWYWSWLSRHRTRAGRRCVSKQLHELIFRMVAENPTWGAPCFFPGCAFAFCSNSYRKASASVTNALRRRTPRRSLQSA